MSTKVLVFESDAAFAGELRSELAKLGCETAVVDDGNAGLQQAASDKPDLILLSIELPRMNGFSVCNKLKKDGKLKDVPLIIMSTESSEETFEQHKKLRTRAEDYVHKPIAFGELLQHINQFIKLAAPAGGEEDGGIVIDDEISSIDIEEEGTLVVEEKPVQPPPAPKGRKQSEAPARHEAAMAAEAGTGAKLKNVDDDIDAFIEGGFGKMTGSSAPAEAKTNGAQAVAEIAEQPQQAKAKSAAPPPPSVHPPANDGRIAELENELMKAREEAAQLRADFDAKIEAEQKKMDAEMEELRQAVAKAPAKGGGVSSREFLDLREALNKKDKELLALREQLGKKDKEIVEIRDRVLLFERQKADLDDKLIASLREVEAAKESAENAARDKDQAKKAADDFKKGLEKTKGELEAKTNELGEIRTKLTSVESDLQARSRELEEARVKIAEDAAAHEAAAAAARADFESGLAKERAERQAALDAAQADKQSALEQAKQQADEERAQAIAARENELKGEHDARLGALHRAHQDEIAKIRGEHAQEKEGLAAKHGNELAIAQGKHEEELDEARNAAQEALARREAELEAKRVSELQAAEQRRAEDVANVERDRDEKVSAAERDRDEKVSAANRDRDERVSAVERDRDEKVSAVERDRDQKIAELERSRDEMVGMMRAELTKLGEAKEAEAASNAARIADLEQQVQKLTQTREGLERDLDEARERIVQLDAEVTALKNELAETKAAHAKEMARAEKAFAKWEQDRVALERAKDALAVVLTQIEDAEGRSIT